MTERKLVATDNQVQLYGGTVRDVIIHSLLVMDSHGRDSLNDTPVASFSKIRRDTKEHREPLVCRT